LRVLSLGRILCSLTPPLPRSFSQAANQQGLADAVAGRVKPARQALETLARKYGISDKET
jgi:hypothetical protein